MVFKEMSISFSVPPSCILHEQASYPGGQWLPGAYLNCAANCLSLSDKRGLDDTMIIWREEGDDSLPVQQMTLKELHDKVWYALMVLITICFNMEFVSLKVIARLCFVFYHILLHNASYFLQKIYIMPI